MAVAARQVSLSLGGSVIDPTDAVGRLLFNVLAMGAAASRTHHDGSPSASGQRVPSDGSSRDAWRL